MRGVPEEKSWKRNRVHGKKERSTNRQWRRDNGYKKRRKQWIWKSPRLQEQSHPLGIPTGAFKGQLRTKRHISVYYIACWGDWRKDERNTAMFGELYIHSSLWHTHTHINTGYSALSLMSTLLQAVLSLHLIFLLTCMWKGWQRWAHNLPTPKHRELDHP